MQARNGTDGFGQIPGLLELQTARAGVDRIWGWSIRVGVVSS